MELWEEGHQTRYPGSPQNVDEKNLLRLILEGPYTDKNSGCLVYIYNKSGIPIYIYVYIIYIYIYIYIYTYTIPFNRRFIIFHEPRHFQALLHAIEQNFGTLALGAWWNNG